MVGPFTDTNMVVKTGGVLKTFLLAMWLHPDVQAIAQAELDRVVGERVPTVDDRENLPFLTAVILECLRWGCPATIGVPHRLMEDDTYGEYFIPAGTTVIAAWSASL